MLFGCSEWGVKILSCQGNKTFKTGLKLGPYSNWKQDTDTAGGMKNW